MGIQYFFSKNRIPSIRVILVTLMYTESINDYTNRCGKIDNTGDEVPIFVVYMEGLTLSEFDALQVEIPLHYSKCLGLKSS